MHQERDAICIYHGNRCLSVFAQNKAVPAVHAQLQPLKLTATKNEPPHICQQLQGSMGSS